MLQIMALRINIHTIHFTQMHEYNHIKKKKSKQKKSQKKMSIQPAKKNKTKQKRKVYNIIKYHKYCKLYS